MFGLRQKLALGFGGLLAILVVVSGLSIVRMDAYSRTLETIFRENYDSVTYGQAMKDAIESLDDAAQYSLWTEAGIARRPTDDLRRQFAAALAREMSNLTLPGERDVSAEIGPMWDRYQPLLDQVIAAESTTRPAAAAAKPARLAAYRDELLPLTGQVKARAQQIIDMNLRNMVTADGQVKQTAIAAKRAMYALLFAGVALSAVFVVAMSRSVLQPLRALTKSAREIERGNLDLVVKARGRDEVGQLAEAFNAMAAKLREFRRSDRAKIARTQRTTQLAVNSLPDAVAIVSPDGRVELANESARRFFQLEPGSDIAAVPAAALADLFRRAARDGRPVKGQGYESALQVFDTGGAERFFLPQAVPIEDPGHALLGVTLVLADVTNLRRIDEMKSGMLSVVSHELKTPLTSIRMGVHLLLEERVGTLTPKQAELLVAARDDADRLHDIIENLLDMGRMQAGRSLMDLRSSSPEELANAAADAIRPSYLDKGVALRVDVPAELPAVSVDADRLEHVFGNLLGNALKYTPAGGTVTVSAEPAGDAAHAADRPPAAVRFTVADTGLGIAKAHLPRIFERFYRVPGQPGATGAGLGLAIAKEIVEAHGGTATVDSVEGEGTRFGFTLPIAGGPTVATTESHVRPVDLADATKGAEVTSHA